ncbi:MAG: amidohydrolase family protein [Sedimentisphaerales bacterium]|nr:amidohydrolase family protein [Sedimentisphaerales bacterium]
MTSNKSTILLRNANLVTPQGIQKGDLLLRDGRMHLNAAPSDCPQLDLTGKYILPGFIDIHIHGHNGFDFTAGLYDQQQHTFHDDQQSFQTGLKMLAQRMPSYGVTSCYPTTVAAKASQLSHCCDQLKQFQQNQNSTGDCKIQGAFLEGSFINKTMAGAQNPDEVFSPEINTFENIENADVIRLANVAPESGPNAIQLIQYLTQKGVVVGAGHTNATADQINVAQKAGLRYAVHFTNGPTGASYKPFDGGGATEAILQNDNLYAEIIADGFHVNPAYILDIIHRKTPQRIIAVTDAMFVTGCKIHTFQVGGVKGRANQDHTCLFVEGKANTLFGSCLTMDRAFQNLLNWLTSDQPGIYNRTHPAQPLDTAVTKLAQMFAANPADLTGLSQQKLGRIADQNIADLTVLNIIGQPGQYQVNVEKTFVDGIAIKQ